MKKIDSLLENKAKNDKAIVEIADSLRETLRKLDDAIAPPKETSDCKRQTVKKYRLSSTAVCRLLSAVFLGVSIGYCLHFPIPATQDKPPIVIPAEETLEEFVASEAGRLLTSDERAKLITVTEKILQQDFSRPSAIVEEFTFQRRIAGIKSPAFNAFSDKWSTKVEDMQPENVEAMRQIYESLLRGLKRSQESGDRSQEENNSRASFEAEILTPDSLLLTPSQQRQRLFRTITTP